MKVDQYLSFYEKMYRIRRFEEAASDAAEDKLIPGPVHQCIGQEAIAVGVCENLRTDDYVLSTHRGHGHSIAKGANPFAMMRELFGREGGTCQGVGGSLHIADFNVGMLGANGVVAANIPIAVGAAQAIKLLDEDKISVCFFGDGAINRGPFSEAINWAKVFDLPVLFVCEDNQYSATTLTSSMTAGGGVTARAASVDMPSAEVDGNDITAVFAAAKEQVAQTRGSGPQLLVAHTYRVKGHTSVDPGAYRPVGEAEQSIKTNDPIRRCAEQILISGGTQASIDAIRSQIDTELSESYEEAKNAPWPNPDLAFANVQDIGSPQTDAF